MSDLISTPSPFPYGTLVLRPPLKYCYSKLERRVREQGQWEYSKMIDVARWRGSHLNIGRCARFGPHAFAKPSGNREVKTASTLLFLVPLLCRECTS